MEIQKVITEFMQWLKTLGDGEATFYGIILTGFFALLSWLITSYRHGKPIKHNATQNIATNGSLSATDINNSSVQISNVKNVKASHRGIAIGVINENKGELKETPDTKDEK